MITSRTMFILENIGLHEEILSRATVVEGMQGMFNRRDIGTLTMNLIRDPTVRYPFPTVLPQPDIEDAFEHILNQRGGHIERGCEVVKIDVLTDYAEVALKSGELIRAKYVVGCDGAHSFVRHCQPWTFTGHPVHILWAQCDGLVQDQTVPTTRAGFFQGKTGQSDGLLLSDPQASYSDFLCTIINGDSASLYVCRPRQICQHKPTNSHTVASKIASRHWKNSMLSFVKRWVLIITMKLLTQHG